MKLQKKKLTLKLCKICVQMTNHHQGRCLKHDKRDEFLHNLKDWCEMAWQEGWNRGDNSVSAPLFIWINSIKAWWYILKLKRSNEHYYKSLVCECGNNGIILCCKCSSERARKLWNTSKIG